MEVTSISYFPTAKTALGSISECIIQLTKMQYGFVQRGNRPPLVGVTLDKEQQEILRIKSNVVFRLEMLFKETVEGGQNPPPTTSHLPPSASPYEFPTIQTAISTISKCIEELLQMQQLMRQIDESLPQSESLDKEQQKVLRIKSSVVSQLEILFKTTKEADDALDDEGLVQGKESVGQQKKEAFKRLSLHGMKETEGKYLCLSNGYEIWCLDLKQTSSNTDPGPLPIISTLNLLGGKLATSVGLFNLGSDAYIIGGKKLPASFKKWDLQINGWPTRGDPEGMDLYRALCYSRGAKGSSRFSYLMALDDGALSPSKGYIEPLNNPKFWPIVENIAGKLHVMDGFPFYLLCDRRCDDEFRFSHEVCEVANNRGGGGGGWKEIPTGGAIERIFNHVVVGDRIYADSHEGRDGDYFLEFDSQTGQWKRLPIGEQVMAFKVKTVWDILSLGVGRCAGEFPFPRGGGGEHERVFVLFAIVAGDYDSHDFTIGAIAVAYLVTLTGQIICYQRVPDFYSEDKLLQPRDMIAATMIRVDEDQERTMCSVVSAAKRNDDRKKEYLFINTFSVEMLTRAAPKVRDLLAKKASQVEVGPAVELEFVRVAVEDRFIYETDLLTWKGGYGRCLGWRACFLTRP